MSSVVESFFGGPPVQSRERSSKHRRESSPSKGYFVREKSPSSRRRKSSPQGYFVREKAVSSSPTRSRRRGSSPGEGIGGIGSMFGFGGKDAYTSSRGMGSWFFGGGGGRHSGSTSAYRRRPRDGYIARLVATIQRLARRLVRYARENPIKLFMLVIMPLVTGGALHKLLKSLGVRLPRSVENLMGGGRGGYEGRGGYDGGYGGGGYGGTGGSGIDLGQVMNVAKMFM